MKTYYLFACLLTGLGLSAFAQAPAIVGPGSVKLGKVAPSVVKTPEFQIVGGQSKRYTLGNWLEVEVDYETKPEEVDELTFKFTILVEKRLLDGEVTYVNIPKGRDHFAVMYVAPRTLDKLTGGKPLTPASIENAWVEVQHQGQSLTNNQPVAFRPSPIPNLQRLPNLVLNKDETPFAPLYFDRYEAIKKGH